MEIAILIGLFFSIESVIAEITARRRKWRIILLFFSLLTSLIPFTFTLVDFIISPKSKVKRLVSSFYSFLYSDRKKEVMNDLFSSGKPVYCNPFEQSSLNCRHFMSLMLWREGDNDPIVFPNGINLNCRVWLPSEDKSSTLMMLEEGYQVYEEREGFLQLYCPSSESMLRAGRKKIKGMRFDFNCFIRESEIVISYDLDSFFMILQTVTGTGSMAESKIVCDFESFLECTKFLNFIMYSRRDCCFVLKDKTVYKTCQRSHCFGVEEALLKIINNEKFVLVNNHGGKNVVEGEDHHTKLINDIINFKMDYKWGKEIKDCLYMYLENNSLEKHKNKIFEIVSKGNWCHKRIQDFGNWQWKRLGVDLSYILERFGCHFLTNCDRSLKPTVRVRMFFDRRDVKEVLERFREKEKSGEVIKDQVKLIPFCKKKMNQVKSEISQTIPRDSTRSEKKEIFQSRLSGGYSNLIGAKALKGVRRDSLKTSDEIITITSSNIFYNKEENGRSLSSESAKFWSCFKNKNEGYEEFRVKSKVYGEMNKKIGTIMQKNEFKERLSSKVELLNRLSNSIGTSIECEKLSRTSKLTNSIRINSWKIISRHKEFVNKGTKSILEDLNDFRNDSKYSKGTGKKNKKKEETKVISNISRGNYFSVLRNLDNCVTKLVSETIKNGLKLSKKNKKSENYKKKSNSFTGDKLDPCNTEEPKINDEDSKDRNKIVEETVSLGLTTNALDGNTNEINQANDEPNQAGSSEQIDIKNDPGMGNEVTIGSQKLGNDQGEEEETQGMSEEVKRIRVKMGLPCDLDSSFQVVKNKFYLNDYLITRSKIKNYFTNKEIKYLVEKFGKIIVEEKIVTKKVKEVKIQYFDDEGNSFWD